MTSTEVQAVKRVNDSAKKSPLKVVSPILKKYTANRQGKIKNKLKFSRVLHGGNSKQKKQIKPQLKTILPKTKAGNVIILESDLLPCALNLLKRKRKECETESPSENCNNPLTEDAPKLSESSQPNECSNKINRSKLVPNNKKKLKCMKNLEASLELLESDTSAFTEKREQAFAENYLFRVQQRLREKDEILYDQFLDLISNFQARGISVCDLYGKIKSIFSSHSDLAEDFVAFLTPEQAIECSAFADHLLLARMADFLNLIDVYFSKSPHQIRKIHSVLESIAADPNPSEEALVNSVLPLLKGNPVLKDYFLHLVPGARPPDNFCVDFEKVECTELNSDASDEEETMEKIHLPEVEDLYGGDSCPCDCHEKKFTIQGQHCLSCSLKFINGKVFIQNGKLLRPAKVVFEDRDMNYHRERLAPKLYPKRIKKKHRQAVFKDNPSPTKSCNLSSDEFKSDVEEEEKGRTKSAVKSPRINPKKSLSPKPSLPRCILAESKDSEEKPLVSKCLDFLFADDKENPTNFPEREVDPRSKTEENDFLIEEESKKRPKFEEGGEEEESSSSAAAAADISTKPLDLPKIDVEDTSSDLLLNRNSVKESNFPERERSHSPPVLSIPESSNLAFANVKPILSMLENLDESNHSPIALEDSPAGEVKLERDGKSPGVEDVASSANGVEMEKGNVFLPWKIEEDRVILQTLQVEKNCEETFLKIGKSIPARSVEDIKKRFAELMNMLYEMKVKTRHR